MAAYETPQGSGLPLTAGLFLEGLDYPSSTALNRASLQRDLGPPPEPTNRHQRRAAAARARRRSAAVLKAYEGAAPPDVVRSMALALAELT